jgi:hypothetical protein
MTVGSTGCRSTVALPRRKSRTSFTIVADVESILSEVQREPARDPSHDLEVGASLYTEEARRIASRMTHFPLSIYIKKARFPER